MARASILLLVTALLSVAFVQTDAKVSAAKSFKLDSLTMKQASSYLPDFQFETLRRLQERLIKFRRLLAAAEANKVCLTDRDTKLYKALEDLEAARVCIYSGLPSAYYYALRDSCASLASEKVDLDHIYKKCDGYKGSNYHKCRSLEYLPAKYVVGEIDARCKRISYGPYGPKDCAGIDPLEALVDSLRKTDCGTGVYTFQEIVAAIKDTTAKIKALLGGAALPSNDPRYYNVPL